MASGSEGKHIMFSYQWNSKAIVNDVYKALTNLGFKVWMDTQGGMHGNVFDSMARGVDNADAVVCFISPDYQACSSCSCSFLLIPVQNSSIINN